ncbi:MAG TPA: transposase [Solirubrobacteraceae bacterium]
MQIAQRTAAARREGFGQLLEWAHKLDSERVWVIEDVRHVSGALERFLIDRGETVVRLAPRLMADARQGVRERGKSDPIDALAIARAALREGALASSSRSGWCSRAVRDVGPQLVDQSIRAGRPRSPGVSAQRQGPCRYRSHAT